MVRIAKVGQQVEPFPAALQSSPMLTQRGLALLLDEVPPNVFHAGEIVHVELDTAASESSE